MKLLFFLDSPQIFSPFLLKTLWIILVKVAKVPLEFTPFPKAFSDLVLILLRNRLFKKSSLDLDLVLISKYYTLGKVA